MAICGYCLRPVAKAVYIGDVGYHEECTRGPGYQPQSYQAWPWPAPTSLTEADVRRIVREELIKHHLVVERDPMD